MEQLSGDSIPYIGPISKKPEFLMSDEEKEQTQFNDLLERIKSYAEPVYDEGPVDPDGLKKTKEFNFRTPELDVFRPQEGKEMGLQFFVYTPYDERYSPSITASWLVSNGKKEPELSYQTRIQGQIYVSQKHILRGSPAYKADSAERLDLMEAAIQAYENALIASRRSDF